jgi:CBS domain-containing protein
MNVRDLMTTDVVSVPPETPLKAVAALLVAHRISGVPVVDAGGRVVGVVSEADFLAKEGRRDPNRRRSVLHWLLDRGRADRVRQRVAAVTAGEAMSSPAHTIGLDRPLAEAARLMNDERIKRLPVVDGERLVGILSRADIVRAYARTDDELLRAVRNALRAVDGLRVIGVEDGVARLAGTVASRALVPTIERIVGEIDGMVGVDDRDVASLDTPAPESVPG